VRIALLTYSTRPRGSVIHTLALAEALHGLGHQVCVFALAKDHVGFDYQLHCRYVLIPAGLAPSNIDALIQQRIQEFVDFFDSKRFARSCYDIYHAQDCISANALIELRQRHVIPGVIRTIHHIEAFNSPYLQACQERSIYEPDRCLCVSDHWQQTLLQSYGIDAPRVVNGVDIQRFSSHSNGTEADLAQRLGLTEAPVYLTVGGIEPRKNSLMLLQAFALVRATYPQAQLIIAGGATLFDYQRYREDFFAQAQQLGFSWGLSPGNAVILPGVISDAEMPVLYRCADAFVFPSAKEGWGLVLLEAIASGLPTITSNQPPFTEFLNSDQALLIDPESPRAIAHAMRLVLNPDVAQPLITNSQSILADYTWEKSAKMHINHYKLNKIQDFCGRRGGAAPPTKN
jgi:glycosyltransferase-like protein